MAAPWQKATATEIVKTLKEVPCSCRRKTVAKNNVETQTEVPCMHEKIADDKKSVETDRGPNTRC